MATNHFTSGFTLIELLVTLALMAVVIPVIVQGLRIATLAGEVAERKALASRIAERVLNEAILSGSTSTAAPSGTEQTGPYQFRWMVKDEPWQALGNLVSSSNSNAVNQAVVNQTLLHQFSVDVNFTAQGRNFNVHLSTLVNTSPTQ